MQISHYIRFSQKTNVVGFSPPVFTFIKVTNSPFIYKLLREVQVVVYFISYKSVNGVCTANTSLSKSVDTSMVFSFKFK